MPLVPNADDGHVAARHCVKTMLRAKKSIFPFFTTGMLFFGQSSWRTRPVFVTPHREYRCSRGVHFSPGIIWVDRDLVQTYRCPGFAVKSLGTIGLVR